MIMSAFAPSRKFAGPACSVLAVLLTACSGSSPGNMAPNAPAQNPPPAQSQPSMSVAELTAPANVSAPNTSPPENAQANAAPANPPGAAPPRQGTLASASYAPHPGTVPSAPGAAPADNAEYAQVVSVTPLSGTQQVCSDQTVTERRPQSDDHQVAGTVIGAIAGGVIGNQFGRGGGRKLTTVAGAIGGGIAGKKIQEAHQEGDTVTRVVKRCRNVVAGRDVPQLFDVVYAYQGQNLHVKLDYDPGSRIALPVRGVQ